ncbi:MAG: phosphoadenylyl-sulfate reductase [Alphaproteobacteria bacterium]|nr:phosphoadenylyl-sulfate reductase [Alphaproteobacteria bacterium]
MSLLVNQLAAAADARDPVQSLVALRSAVVGPIRFTTSFGLEDQVITHLIASHDVAIDIVTLDTGRLFPETVQVWAETEARYQRRIRAVIPDATDVEALLDEQGSLGFRLTVAARQRCCQVRKVDPLRRALAGAAGWVTGLRADQSTARAEVALVSFDPGFGLIKLNPLLRWSREEVVRFAAAHHVPINGLHAQGYLSIGCAPCTRAIAPGEPERAGRWWWEDDAKKECGLHLAPDGRLVPSLVGAGS